MSDNHKTTPPSIPGGTSIPFYRRRWFLVLAVLVVIAGAGLGLRGCSKKGNASSSEADPALVSKAETLRDEIGAMTLPEGANDQEREEFQELQEKAQTENLLYGLEVIKEKLENRQHAVQERLDKKEARSDSSVSSDESSTASSESEQPGSSEQSEDLPSTEASEEEPEPMEPMETMEETSISTDSSDPLHLCSDGTRIDYETDLSAAGQANACYGHGGFVY